uniref:Putative structural protein n=1 Tax=Picornavirales N_OV_039 TaxID=2016020 RepID=A0A218NJR1_9VIRU|nr:putative structural protein [Picornavirales N_OV_039]
MRFSDGSPDEMNYSVKTGSDKTRSSRDSDEVDLSNFLGRPIKIDSRTVAPGSSVHHVFNPWKTFLENPRVSNRISNYNLLRCTLKVKFLINGNGFYYGRFIASYLPLKVWDELSQNRGAVPQDIIQASQQPHIYIDPTTSTGGEMTLPFFFYKDYMNVPDGDWGSMGEICIRDINQLQHANDGTDPLTITTFAWAEDVQLSIPTSLNAFGLVAQGDIIDETDEANIKGVISGPASSIAAMAANLKTVPKLGPYATAAEKAASLTAGVAKLMGYSRPAVTRSPDPFTPANHSSMANCTTPDFVNKLSVDDKQGLGMGSELAGIESEDPLTVLSIAQRESYLTTFPWTTSQAVDDLIFNIKVMPTLHDKSGSPSAMHLPALAVAAVPFQYWTGTLNFRFQVVASAYHKGRLRVVYDPHYLSATPEFNVNYQEIVDIEEKQDFTISVSNSQDLGIIPVKRPAFEAVTDMFSTTRFNSWTESNGVLGVYVLNELVTPNTTLAKNGEINVFVSAGPDFKVFSPNDDLRNYEFAPQGDIMGDNSMGKLADTAKASEPVTTMATTIASGNEMVDEVTRVYAGECVASFRQLLKRYAKHSTLTDLDTGSVGVRTEIRSAFPYLRGGVDGAVDTADLGVGAWNYSNTLLIHWITLCFSGWRGGIRFKVIPTGFNNTEGLCYSAVASRSFGLLGYASTTSGYTVPTTMSELRYDGLNTLNKRSLPYGGGGMAHVNSSVNNVLSFEVPYQLQYRFAPGKIANWTGVDPWCNIVEMDFYSDASTRGRVDQYNATGEDFQVYFWTGLPPVYYDNTPPPPDAL